MALYHFSVRHVSRGKGQMVVASAAYIFGQRIFDSYYNKIHDYTSKSGVVFTEILTPEYVPERLTCLLYTSPSPRDRTRSRMPSSA